MPSECVAEIADLGPRVSVRRFARLFLVGTAEEVDLGYGGSHGSAVPMRSFLQAWTFWALLSAGFAALTAIFAKVGVAGVNSDFATFLRTLVIVAVLAGMLTWLGEWRPLGEIGPRTYVFLALSGLATGGSWLCYFRALQLGDAARVAPIDKLSVVLVALFGVAFLGEKLSLANWLGVALIAAGATLVAYRG